MISPRNVELPADTDSRSMLRLQCVHGVDILVTPLLLVLASRLKDEVEQHVTRCLL